MMYVNLLSAESRVRLIVKRRLLQWRGVWVVILFVVAVSLISRIPAVLHGRTMLDDAHSRSLPTRRLMAEVQDLRTRLADAEAERAKLTPLISEDGTLFVLGLLAEALGRTGDDLYLQSLNYSRSTTISSARGGAIETVVVQGIAPDDSAVSRFVDALHASPYVRHVELKSCNREIAEIERRRFELIFEL